jgi:hypothetical protein
MSEQRTDPYTDVLRVTNSLKTPVDFWLEPWGDCVEMPAGADYVVIAEGPEGNSLEVDLRPDGITVWAWGGSIAAVYQGETLIIDCTQVRFPELSGGKNMRDALGTLFGEGLLRQKAH